MARNRARGTVWSYRKESSSPPWSLRSNMSFASSPYFPVRMSFLSKTGVSRHDPPYLLKHSLTMSSTCSRSAVSAGPKSLVPWSEHNQRRQKFATGLRRTFAVFSNTLSLFLASTAEEDGLGPAATVAAALLISPSAFFSSPSFFFVSSSALASVSFCKRNSLSLAVCSAIAVDSEAASDILKRQQWMWEGLKREERSMRSSESRPDLLRVGGQVPRLRILPILSYESINRVLPEGNYSPDISTYIFYSAA